MLNFHNRSNHSILRIDANSLHQLSPSLCSTFTIGQITPFSTSMLTRYFSFHHRYAQLSLSVKTAHSTHRCYPITLTFTIAMLNLRYRSNHSILHIDAIPLLNITGIRLSSLHITTKHARSANSTFVALALLRPTTIQFTTNSV